MATIIIIIIAIVLVGVPQSSLPNEEDLDPPPDIHAFLQFIKTGNQQGQSL